MSERNGDDLNGAGLRSRENWRGAGYPCACQSDHSNAEVAQLAHGAARSLPHETAHGGLPEKPISRGQRIPVTDFYPFYSLLPPHGGVLRRLAFKLTAHERRAEDRVQETFLKAWTNRDKFRLGADLRGWMFTILRNTFYSERRTHKCEVEDDLVQATP